MRRKYKVDTDAFERQEQLQEYLDALRQGVLPLKFAYIGRAAHTHDQLVRSREYGLADTEAELIKMSFPKNFLPRLKGLKLHVFDIGSGNGMKAIVVLNLLKEAVDSLAYTALDYSQELLKIALENMAAEMPWLKTSSFLVDFEVQPLRWLVQKARPSTTFPGIFLLLGHTLGNPRDRDVALRNVTAGMQWGDFLVAGVELYQPNRVREILAHYKNEPFYQAVFNPLTFVGLQRNDGVLSVEFNNSTRDVEVSFTPQKEVAIELRDSEVLRLESGKRIEIFVSHRFTKEEFSGFLLASGLVEVEPVYSHNDSYALVLSSLKTRYGP